MSSSSRRGGKPSFRVGFALTQKKQRSFLQPSLLHLALTNAIEFVCIDVLRPLSQQGPFDAILHKLCGEDWRRQLADYSLEHPGVVVIDNPEAIQRLHNRVSMLEPVSALQMVGDASETVGIPGQFVLYQTSDLRVGMPLKFPVVAKPLVADGKAESHAMSLVFNVGSLSKLTPPLVLQEFVNHGGVVFKVYVVGEHVQCVPRMSLPDVQEHEFIDCEEPLSFSQISNVSLVDHHDTELPGADLPSSKFISSIANGLRKFLGLRLFNFDVIRDSENANHYYVIDINYFPGYSKLPHYENIITDLFLTLLHEQIATADS